VFFGVSPSPALAQRSVSNIITTNNNVDGELCTIIVRKTRVQENRTTKNHKTISTNVSIISRACAQVRGSNFKQYATRPNETDKSRLPSTNHKIAIELPLKIYNEKYVSARMLDNYSIYIIFPRTILTRKK